jgi:hypothetical protein
MWFESGTMMEIPQKDIVLKRPVESVGGGVVIPAARSKNRNNGELMAEVW